MKSLRALWQFAFPIEAWRKANWLKKVYLLITSALWTVGLLILSGLEALFIPRKP